MPKKVLPMIQARGSVCLCSLTGHYSHPEAESFSFSESWERKSCNRMPWCWSTLDGFCFVLMQDEGQIYLFFWIVTDTIRLVNYFPSFEIMISRMIWCNLPRMSMWLLDDLDRSDVDGRLFHSQILKKLGNYLDDLRLQQLRQVRCCFILKSSTHTRLNPSYSFHISSLGDWVGPCHHGIL